MRLRTCFFALMMVGLAVWPATSLRADSSEVPSEDYYELQKLLVDTLDQVERNYVKDVSRRQLIEAAIKGVLQELDPYSSYISPDQLDGFRTSVDSQFGGIGVQITMDAGRLKVISPLVDTPAYRAGILAGDWIVRINDKSTQEIKAIDEAVRHLKGETGSDVKLTVVHAGTTEKVDITVTREIVHVETVLGDHRDADDTWSYFLDDQKNIGYIRLTAFSRDTAKKLRKTLADLKKQEARGLILDLRFNPGGLLGSAIEICDLFIDKGRIVSTEGRNSPERVWKAHKGDSFEHRPMVVLVNRYSASASEIVSACLQDHDRAVVIGERTWGKGSVQNVIELEDRQSALKLTTASYRRPSGKNIHRFPDAEEDDEWGVLPNQGYLLKLSDREMSELIRDRRQRDILRPNRAAEPTKTAKRNPKADGKPDSAKPSADKDESDDTEVVDQQLRMAVDYLTDELARVE